WTYGVEKTTTEVGGLLPSIIAGLRHHHDLAQRNSTATAVPETLAPPRVINFH
ncbi:hypothetical protein HAX54_011388, partial [Datura stramonium]|nr:hypothetical protein [Datura stramonium]